MKPIQDLFDEAIRCYGKETHLLRFLPENRYNRRMFPTTGQYDWFSGQLLYCLVRLLKPKRIIEISTSSGYSTLFMALALRKNEGIVDTFEIDRSIALSAKENFERFNVTQYVHTHIGDAKVMSETLDTLNADILFLDSLHSESFARWFIESFVLTASEETLFHMHDILPRHARVRKYGGPPFEKKQENIYQKMRNFARNLIKGKRVSGGEATEAIFGNKLAQAMSPIHYLFCYDIADKYESLSPREYDAYVVGREDSSGRPFEWNESFWAYAGPLAEAYRKLDADSS